MSDTPTTVEERIIVLLCISREDINPDPKRVIKYPKEIKRKSDPASPWPIPRSFSILGIKGAKMILAIKFRKKIAVKKRRGVN